MAPLQDLQRFLLGSGTFWKQEPGTNHSRSNSRCAGNLYELSSGYTSPLFLLVLHLMPPQVKSDAQPHYW
jgi:hypothetical protein